MEGSHRCSTRTWFACGLAIVLAVGLPAPAAEASLGGAIADLVSAVFALPSSVLAGTFGGPPVIGTIAGALQGAVNTVGYATRSALQFVGVAIPLAAKIAPFIPLFL